MKYPRREAEMAKLLDIAYFDDKYIINHSLTPRPPTVIGRADSDIEMDHRERESKRSIPIPRDRKIGYIWMKHTIQVNIDIANEIAIDLTDGGLPNILSIFSLTNFLYSAGTKERTRLFVNLPPILPSRRSNKGITAVPIKSRIRRIRPVFSGKNSDKAISAKV